VRKRGSGGGRVECCFRVINMCGKGSAWWVLMGVLAGGLPRRGSGVDCGVVTGVMLSGCLPRRITGGWGAVVGDMQANGKIGRTEQEGGQEVKVAGGWVKGVSKEWLPHHDLVQGMVPG